MSSATAEIIRCGMNGNGKMSTGERIIVAEELTKEMTNAYKEQRVIILSPRSPYGPVRNKTNCMSNTTNVY